MAEVKISITAEDGATRVFRAVEGSTKDAGKGVDGFGRACERAKSHSLDFVKGLVGFEVLKRAAAWLKSTADGFLGAADATEQYGVRLKVLLGSTEEGARLFKNMADYAGRVPFEFEEIMGAATQLAGVMKGGVEEINRWMPLIGDVAAASGLSVRETTEQIIRMYSAGAASADLFRERGILAMMGFQAGVSYSAEETRKKLMEAWEDPASKFRDASGELATTWKGLISMLSDKWFKFRTDVMDSGPFEFLKATLSELNDYLDQSGKRLSDIAASMGGDVLGAIKKTIKAGAFAKDVFDGLHMTVLGISLAWKSLHLAFVEAGGWFSKLEGWKKKGLTAISPAIGGVLDYFGEGFDPDKAAKLRSEIEKTSEKISEMGSHGIFPTFNSVDALLKEIEERISKVKEDVGGIGKPAPTVDTSQAIEALRKLGATAKAAKEQVDEVTPTGQSEAVKQLSEGVFQVIPPERKKDITELRAEFNDIAAAAERLRPYMDMAWAQEELTALSARAGEIRGGITEIAEPHLKLDSLFQEMKEIEKAFINTSTIIEGSKKINVDGSQALSEAQRVKDAVESIPDKTVRVEVKTVYTGDDTKALEQSIADNVKRGSSPLNEAFAQ